MIMRIRLVESVAKAMEVENVETLSVFLERICTRWCAILRLSHTMVLAKCPAI